ALARHVLALGTTTLFADTLQFWELGGVRAFTAVADALARSPVKFYWVIRPPAQSPAAGERQRVSLPALPPAPAPPSALPLGAPRRGGGCGAGRASVRAGRICCAVWPGREYAGSVSRATPPARRPRGSRLLRRAVSARITSRSPRARCSTARARASPSCCASRRCAPISAAC